METMSLELPGECTSLVSRLSRERRTLGEINPSTSTYVTIRVTFVGTPFLEVTHCTCTLCYCHAPLSPFVLHRNGMKKVAALVWVVQSHVSHFDHEIQSTIFHPLRMYDSSVSPAIGVKVTKGDTVAEFGPHR